MYGTVQDLFSLCNHTLALSCQLLNSWMLYRNRPYTQGITLLVYCSTPTQPPPPPHSDSVLKGGYHWNCMYWCTGYQDLSVQNFQININSTRYYLIYYRSYAQYREPRFLPFKKYLVIKFYFFQLHSTCQVIRRLFLPFFRQKRLYIVWSFLCHV